MAEKPVAEQKSSWTAGRIGALALGLVAAALIFVNSEETTVDLILWEVAMPLSIILFIMFALGYVTALIASRFASKN